MSNLPLGLPEFRMTNANNPQSEKKGAFIYGNDAKAKNSVKSSLRVP